MNCVTLLRVEPLSPGQKHKILDKSKKLCYTRRMYKKIKVGVKMAGSTQLTLMQEKFAVAVVLNGGKKLEAFKEAGYSQGYNKTSMKIQASKLYNNPKVRMRIKELQKRAAEVADKKFTISVKQRLLWLKEVAEAGLEKQTRVYGESVVQQRENLAATNQAINVMNNMLGVSDEEEKAQPLSITFNVAAPVGDVRVTKGGTTDE